MIIKVKVFGYTEEQLRAIAESFLLDTAFSYAVSENNLDACLTLSGKDDEVERFNSVTSDLLKEIKGNIYGEGEVTLGEMAIEYLSYRDKTLAVCESITGGLIADSIISISGASKVFIEGIIAYSNESKIRRLNVPRYVIDTHGAVSYECASEMAQGLLRNKDIDIAIATTGIAGPLGGSDNKPVGLTYICIADGQALKVYNHIFQGDRNSIRVQAANTALFYLINKLKG